MNQNTKNPELPLGLGMALGMHPDAMAQFANMSAAQKQQVIDHAEHIQSKSEMQAYISSLGSQTQ